ncbi:MAG: ceramidase domain-containing protein [Bdellovibrionales bacterium]|nr:ceramidase domain-containing protein [Bdellovibrionales bacterium]
MDSSAAQCPWDFLQPATIHFCERSLCAWVTQPANAWSNIGFILAGILILRNYKGNGLTHLTWFGWISILIGLCSGFFHSTSSLFGQTIDFGSMFLLSTFMMMVNTSRWLGIWSARFLTGFLVFLAVSLTLLTLFPITGIPLFGFQFLSAMAIEAKMAKQLKGQIRYTDLFALLTMFALSLGIWTLDITHVVCAPDNHILTGHSLWHLGNATAIYLGGRFYSQFQFAAPLRRFVIRSTP